MRRLLLIAPVFLVAGCLTTTVVNPKAADGELKVYPKSHFMGGFGTAVIKVDCPNGIKSITEGRTFGNQMLGGLTLGIWNPGTAKVVCAK